MIKLRETIEARKLMFDQEIAGAGSENIAVKILHDKRKFLCQNDLFYLCCLTGDDLIAKYPEYYRPICDEIALMNWQILHIKMHKMSRYGLRVDEVTDDPKKDLCMERMYLCHRTFYKTTIITKKHTVQLLLNFPDIVIALCHNRQDNSSDNLMAIKNTFLSSSLKYLYPEYIPDRKDWGNMSGFSVACRSNKSRSEDSVEAIGVDTEITGRHWQVAKKNDLVTEKSVNTEEQIKKTLDWDNRFNQGHFDDPQITLQDYEGTRYHHVDLYSVKINNPRIKVLDFPLLKDKDPKNLAVENISNPDRFSVEGVQEMMRDMWVFNCQMLLKPDDPARMQFNEGMISYFSFIPSVCNFYLLIDPASRRKKRSDYTVMLVVGLAWYEGRIRKFIVDGIRDKIDPKRRVDEAIRLAKKWKIKGCGWEAIGFQETDVYYFKEKRKEERLFFSVTEINSQTASKEDRIRSLVPDYTQHNWLWPKKGSIVNMGYDGRNYDLTDDMELELTQFPLCKHDDIMDDMTFINKIPTIKPPEIKGPEEQKQMTFGTYGALKDERLNATKGKNPYELITSGIIK